jgi:hypothetical protein
LEGSFEGALNADLGQAIRHFFGALGSAAAGIAQTLNQGLVGMVKTQTHNVNCFACKGDGNLDTREVLHAFGFGCSYGSFLAANFVVVCEGPELDAVGFGTRSQSLGRERAIRDHGVAMQVGVE